MDDNLGLIRLTPDYDILPFDCGDDDLNKFLLNDAKAYQEKLLAVTYLVEAKDKTVLYFCLSNDKVTKYETGKSLWRKIKSYFPHSKHRKDYPAVKIGRLAVHSDFQHKKEERWGSSVLDYIKEWMTDENKTGCRFITVDAYRDAVDYYYRNKFKFMGTEEENRYLNTDDPIIAMYFDLAEITDTPI